MSDVPLGGRAEEALIKLLIKLHLLESESDAAEFAASGQGALTFYAGKGCFDVEDAARIVAEHLHLPVFRLDRATTDRHLKLFDQPPFATIPLNRWSEMRALPVEAADDHVVVAFANPLDYEAKNTLEFALGLSVKLALGLEEEILGMLGQKMNSSPLFDIRDIIEKSTKGEAPAESSSGSSAESTVAPDLSAAPVVRLVNKIFAETVQAGASDVHLTPEKSALMVRMRVDGILQPSLEVPREYRQAVISRIKLLGGMDIAEKRKPQDGRLRVNTTFGVRDLRLSTVPTVYGENLVIRILSPDFGRVNFDSLGMHPETQSRFTRALKGSSRVVLVSGPTGSGKSSTMYAALLSLRDGATNIITVEDPIEYRLAGVNQIQVNPKIGITFAEGLRAVLRQDPDVIMVGEVRDKDTAAIVMQAAQTGHLVLSTIHTNTAAGTVTRLLDLGIAPFMAAASLGCVVAQRLVRRLCESCATEYGAELPLGYERLGLTPETMRAPAGCDTCGKRGYAGRIGIYSLLEINEAVREAIRGGANEREIEEAARGSGFETLEEAAVRMVNSGVTTLDEVERALGSLAGLGLETGASPNRGVVEAGGAAHGALARQRILLVEDDEDTRAVLSLLLRGEMFDVDEAVNGHDALEKIYNDVPQLIICDLMMPKMDGAEMVKRLRRDSRMKNIPVLMLTAADSEDNEIKAIGGGADDFVSKTADAKVMLARVYRLLERSSVSA